MEIHPDGHPIEDERRLGEHCGLGLSLENQFIVKYSVVGDASLGIFHFLFSGSVRNNLELNLQAGHDADLQSVLGSGQPPDNPLLGLLACCHLFDNLGKKL